MYYDKGARILQELKEGETVKIANETNCKPHQSGVVIGQAEGPRSYKIKNERGDVIVRNRKMLIRGGEYKDKRYDNIEGENVEVEHRKINNENSQKNQSVVKYSQNMQGTSTGCNNLSDNAYNSSYTTRSGRISKRPTYLKDFV